MRFLKRLWQDEHGMVMSAEMVMLGTVGVLSLTAGIGVMTTAVNDELTEMGQAFRSFNQDFNVVGFQSSFSGGASGTGRGSAQAASTKMGSSFSQSVNSAQAAQNVVMEYMPARNKQQEMRGEALNATIAAQRSFEAGALSAANLQQSEAQLFQQRKMVRQLEEQIQATSPNNQAADKAEKKRRRRQRRSK
jgi:hypothetical protein